MVADGVSQFQVLGLQLGAAFPFVTHVIIKQHASEHTQAGLFVAGLPLNVDTDAVTTLLFSCFGDVAGVVLHQSKTSALVIYEESASVKAALKAAAAGSILACDPPQSQQVRGLKAWVQQHKAKRPGNAVLGQQLDSWMERYDAEEERQRKAREAAMAEDGWTVVTRAKGHKRTREEEGVTYVTGGVASAAAAAAAVAKKPKVHETFYRFQQREKRRDELLELRQKFEADKKRIQELRNARKFRPS